MTNPPFGGSVRARTGGASAVVAGACDCPRIRGASIDGPLIGPFFWIALDLLFLEKFQVALDARSVAPGLQDFCVFDGAAAINRQAQG